MKNKELLSIIRNNLMTIPSASKESPEELTVSLVLGEQLIAQLSSNSEIFRCDLTEEPSITISEQIKAFLGKLVLSNEESFYLQISDSSQVYVNQMFSYTNGVYIIAT